MFCIEMFIEINLDYNNITALNAISIFLFCCLDKYIIHLFIY